jgi:pimeloyl-ACP methyl ester carboxylesterase
MPTFLHDGLSFNYADVGAGTPFVFQHGLGGDVNQPLGLFRPPAGFRLLCLDARGHGRTVPLGDEDKLSLAQFADDLLSFLDYLGISKAVIGGISMGAGVTLNFTLRYPQRVLGLVQSRPAWIENPRPENVYWCSLIAGLLRQYGTQRGKAMFLASPEYAELFRESPDVASSLVRQFENAQAEESIARLERIPPDRPFRGLEELKAISVPTLILANRQDPIHPFEYGEVLSRAIPGSQFREITAKSVSSERHTADVQANIETFLTEHFGGSS